MELSTTNQVKCKVKVSSWCSPCWRKLFAWWKYFQAYWSSSMDGRHSRKNRELLKPWLWMWLKRVYKAYNTQRRPSQRLQEIPHKYCFILKLFKVLISHGYFNSLHSLLRIWSTEDLFPRLENKVGYVRKGKLISN